MTAKYYTANKAGEESLKGKLVFELDLERWVGSFIEGGVECRR
jgi:hypothetical protein